VRGQSHVTGQEKEAIREVNVVLIDDDALVLRNLQSVLEDLGFSITAFEKPLVAIEWIEKHGADIVISDIKMPECDGFEVLERVKRIDPACDLIFITAYAHSEHAIKALRQGATDFFHKPFKLAELQAAIERTSRFRTLSRQKALLTAQVDALSLELFSRNRAQSTMLGQSPAMRKVTEETVDIAATRATVLITGESGTGKELVANAIHQMSPLSDKPFITVNCASIPDELFESEMFGHKRGAFTGALENRSGYVDAANGGTLFLDEIGDMPLAAQPKILRLLEQRVYRTVGETREKDANIRLIAATNRRLEEMVESKEFRSDLYYRLGVCAISLPALRERKEDIGLLALYFLLHFAQEMGKPIEGISDEALRLLGRHDYPGNVRELRNLMENTVIHCRHDGMIQPDDLPDHLTSGGSTESTESPSDAAWPIQTIKFEEVERLLYTEALNRTDENVTAAARLLGISRGKLRRRMSMLGMDAAD